MYLRHTTRRKAEKPGLGMRYKEHRDHVLLAVLTAELATAEPCQRSTSTPAPVCQSRVDILAAGKLAVLG